MFYNGQTYVLPLLNLSLTYDKFKFNKGKT